jgi:hypothetical protein
MKTIILAGAGVAAFAAFAASAQPPAPSAPPPPAGAWREAPPAPRDAHPVTRAEVKAKVDSRFARLDSNRDGYLTPDEIAAGHGPRGQGFAMRRMRPDGPTGEGPMAERQMREGPLADERDGRAEVFARLDSNHDGVVTRDEFMKAGPGSARVERRVFVMRDGDGPGREGPGMGPRGGMRGGGMRGHMIERMDSNHDGRVSLAEAEARALQAFDRADANHDGIVTPEERQAARGMMRERFQERRPG